MPPPGFAPYSKDHIPPSFMNKQPIPAGADSNIRAYVIFFGYMGLCASLTVFIIQKLLKSYIVLSKSTTARPPPRKHVLLFAALAAGSLLTTWYYMFQYFKVSYEVWLMWRSYYDVSDDQRHWGLWLKETTLFKDAWEVAIVGNARYWWTHQIFFFAWQLGLDLERQGVRRGVRHGWAFMLLGQIVAISFATNLFLLALLLSPPTLPAAPTSGVNRRRWLGPWLLNFLAIIATEIPAYLLADQRYWHSKQFMPLLLTPHLVLLVLPFARAIVPAKYLTADEEFADGVYKVLWKMTIAGAAVVWLRTTSAAYSYSGLYGIWSALLEHPAISSVGFDVIFCWITWIAWEKSQWKGGLEGALRAEKESDEGGWEGAGSGTTVSNGNMGGAVRRR